MVCRSHWFVLRLTLAVTLLLAGASSGAQGWKPTENVEIIAPAGPGGAIDRTARLIQKLIHEHRLLDVTTSVVNKPGGGHSIGYAYLNQHAGNGHYLMVTSTNLVTNYIGGTSRIHHGDVSPVALLFNEYVVFCVSTESPVKNAQGLVEAFKTRPETLSTGVGSSISGANSVAVGLVAKVAGGDPRKLRIVAFKSAADSATALMGGHLGLVAVSPGIVLSGVKSGKFRPLAVAAPRRLGGEFAGVPTWKEVGIGVVVGNWRILIAPKGLRNEQLEYWDQVMAKVVATAGWLEQLEQNSAQPEYMNSAATKRFLEEQEILFRNTFAELGMMKK